MLSKTSIPTSFFVLVVVRFEQRYLLIQERKYGQSWYLPAGRVKPGESLVQAAERETFEEAGIPIVLEGIVRIEHSPEANGSARLRVIFVAKPQTDQSPKSEPDKHSLQAQWVMLEELDDFALRGEDVPEIFQYIAQGGPIYPLDLITVEGAPFVF
jgi:8-oxo-dGTP pyrophosphatase MutT (NUDIX family)